MTTLQFYYIDFNVSIILNREWFHCKILMCVLHWVMRPFNSRVCVLICNVISISLFAKRKNIALMLYYFHKIMMIMITSCYIDFQLQFFVCLTVEWRMWWSLDCNQVSNQLLKFVWCFMHKLWTYIVVRLSQFSMQISLFIVTAMWAFELYIEITIYMLTHSVIWLIYSLKKK